VACNLLLLYKRRVDLISNKNKLLEVQMCKYLGILIGICLVASSAHGVEQHKEDK
jgi:hypothetical protein